MIKTHLQEGMENLKELFLGMMYSVREQVVDARTALINGDVDLAEIVNEREKAINRKELVIDKECEKVLALYGPVAIDLRLVLSIIEMNTHLERLGDLAQMIAEGVIRIPAGKVKKAIEILEISEMYEDVIDSLHMTISCFEEDDISNTPKILIKNKGIKARLANTKPAFAKLIKKHHEDAEFILTLFSISRAILRMLDMIDNVVEEIVFYVEAKIIKHKKKKHKKIEKHLHKKELESEESESELESGSDLQEQTTPETKPNQEDLPYKKEV